MIRKRSTRTLLLGSAIQRSRFSGAPGVTNLYSLSRLHDSQYSLAHLAGQTQHHRSRGQRHCSGAYRIHISDVQHTYVSAKHIILTAARPHKETQDPSPQALSPIMCYVEDVFHAQCGHWGRRRFSGAPCVRSRIVDGISTGCSEVELVGMANSDQLCYICKRHRTPSLPNLYIQSPAMAPGKARAMSLGTLLAIASTMVDTSQTGPSSSTSPNVWG